MWYLKITRTLESNQYIQLIYPFSLGYDFIQDEVNAISVDLYLLQWSVYCIHGYNDVDKLSY